MKETDETVMRPGDKRHVSVRSACSPETEEEMKRMNICCACGVAVSHRPIHI